ncbi:16S rRNA (uracil(1498)-N(3))-methyltransferase [Thauera sinica]|uniref:Ribosomal RNA small subunit methyltransferase E n=1 Tax=Thauera sinica TaxID=2665146 RepID=A0ABW1ALV8_9RHOO|nr:16S rRNA (uracil(1498)-N(3))-methyltransferase [Thauera sp. K11]ATE60872.1 16S rRNA (uracil(1498)-N(3))-methyltransferase [Thauera sp. K11]
MISRFHFPQPLPHEGEIELPEAVAHHAARVLRLADGDPLVLFDGLGGEVEARLLLRGRAAFAELCRYREPRRESPLRLVLVQALATGDKMDWIVQKAVELGVAGVQPIQAERSVLRLAGERAEKRRAHWQQVAVSACEQSGRNRVPEVGMPMPLANWLAAGQAQALCYVLAPDGGEAAFGTGPRPAAGVQLMIGPEGGWTAHELAACRAAGCIAVGLGPRVLRTETAGLAAIAVLQARWGDF